MVGGLFSEHAAKLIEEYTSAGGHALSEFCIHCFHHGLQEVKEHPPLEVVLRAALRAALDDLRRGLEPQMQQAYGEWFDNWNTRLSDVVSGISDIRQLWPSLADEDELASERTLRDLFRGMMERLDGEVRARQTADPGIALSITGGRKFREMPAELVQVLTERLSVLLQARFDELVALPAHSAAWIAVEQTFHRYVTAELQTIRDDTRRIRDVLENQLILALEDRRIVQDEVRVLRAQFEELAEKYRKFEADVITQIPAPDEMPLAALLEAGNLDAAVRLKLAQIEKNTGEGLNLARDWAELGRLHELRFAFADAMESYGEAWRLHRLVEYGFRYAEFARLCNRLGEATAVLQELLCVDWDASQRAFMLNCLALLYCNTQRMKEGEGFYEKALSIYRRLAKADPETYLPDLDWTLNRLALLYSDTQRMKEAERSYQEVLSIRRRLAEADPETYLHLVCMTLSDLANLFSSIKRMKEAESSHQELLSIRRRLAKAHPEGVPITIRARLLSLKPSQLSLLVPQK